MPINFSHLRLQNLFGSPDFKPSLGVDINSLLQPQQEEQIPEQDGVDNGLDMIRQIYAPRHDFSDKLTEALGEMPTREQFGKPGKLRKLGGILAGFSTGMDDPLRGMQTKERFLNKDYYQAQGDWKDKINTLMKGATEEDKYNINQRLLATGVSNRDINLQKLDLQKIRTKAYDFSKRNPNHIYKIGADGSIIGINPQNNQTEILKDDDGNPIKSNVLSDKEKIELQNTGRLNVTKEAGSQARQTEGTKQINRLTNIEESGKQRRLTKGAPGNFNSSPTQEKVNQYNNARKALLEHPEWSNYITLDKNGPNTFEVHPPSSGHWFSSGPDDKTHKAITEAILGKPGSAADKKIDTVQQKTDTKTEETRVNVVDITTGKVIGTIPKGDVSKLDTKKYKVQ